MTHLLAENVATSLGNHSQPTFVENAAQNVTKTTNVIGNHLANLAQNLVTTEATPPELDYFGFFNEPTVKREINKTEMSATWPTDDHHFNTWVAVLAVGCFLCGMLVSSGLAYVIYKKQRTKWRRLSDSSITSQDSFTRLPLNNAPRPHSPDLTKHTLISEETKRPITVIPNKFYHRQSNLTVARRNELPPHTSYSGIEQPFVNIFSELVTSTGCEIGAPCSDVVLAIPPGAVPRGRKRDLYINVALSGNVFNAKAPSPDHIQVTPVVEVFSPGLKKFSRHVTLRVPHRTEDCPGELWEYVVLLSNGPLGSNTSWEEPRDSGKGAECNKHKEVIIRLVKGNVYIDTLLPSAYVCFGRPLVEPTMLRLSTMIYARLAQDRCNRQETVYLHLYICDNYTDMHKRIDELEVPFGAYRVSERVPVTMKSGNDWQVRLLHSEDARWPWKLVPSDTAIKTISLSLDATSMPPCVEFRLVPRDPVHDLPTLLQASLSIQQFQKEASITQPVHVITNDIRLQDLRQVEPLVDTHEPGQRNSIC